MRVEKLELEGFRNIKYMQLAPGTTTNVIWGDNAQGKTNLLEAIWLFCGAKSFRGAKDAEFIGFDGEGAALQLEFLSGARTQNANLRWRAEGKSIQLNGIKQRSVSELSGVFCAVVFSPDHLELIKHGPRQRRRMLDISLCQAYPKYQKVLGRYEQILRRRAVLLRDIAERLQPMDTLDAWDESLVEYGSYIAWMRARYTAKLADYAAQAYDGISSGRECFGAHYKSSFGNLSLNLERAAVRDLMANAVLAGRGEDLRLGTNCVGPHRDDLEILVGDKSARTYASQGQQRSCVLALKLAECRILEESGGEAPVVLLDDVMSELDEGRRRYLMSRLFGKQVFITCCDKEILRDLPDDAKAFALHAGALVE